MGCGKVEKKSEQRIGNTEWVIVFKIYHTNLGKLKYRKLQDV